MMDKALDEQMTLPGFWVKLPGFPAAPGVASPTCSVCMWDCLLQPVSSLLAFCSCLLLLLNAGVDSALAVHPEHPGKGTVTFLISHGHSFGEEPFVTLSLSYFPGSRAGCPAQAPRVGISTAFTLLPHCGCPDELSVVKAISLTDP